MSFIQLEKIKKSYGKTQTIHGISLDIIEGEFVVFVGPSGCGKSTLLRMIAGLEEITEGRVSIGGTDVTHTSPSERKVAMVFQSYALYPHMTVAENLSFGMRMRGVDKQLIKTKVDRAVKMLQLEPYLERRPAELSGGQCQRVAIGRALVQDPSAFLFDEPLSNLDAELRLRMRVEISALHKELGKTMIYVTHDQVEAMTLADKIVVLRNGLVEQVGAPLALYANPCNEFVATFIGSPAMNLFDAKCLKTGDNRASISIGVSANFDFSMGDKATLAADNACRVGIRPEHIEVVEIHHANAFAATVKVVERLGATTYVYAKLAANQQDFCIEASGSSTIKAGDTIAVMFDPAKCHLFDATGKAVPKTAGVV
jgi:lactose/L-arabinose transport system ATP-binding protein